MEKEKIFKSHKSRDDLAGENPLGDIGQVILLLVFLAAWIIDSFFLKISLVSNSVPIYIRIPLAGLFLIFGLYLAKQGLNIVFAEVRAKPIVIRKGVFSIVRHPIYLGAICFYLAMLAFSLSLIAASICVVVILFYFYLCKYEEKVLLLKYGEEYKRYMSEVPMLIPRIGKKHADS